MSRRTAPTDSPPPAWWRGLPLALGVSLLLLVASTVSAWSSSLTMLFGSKVGHSISHTDQIGPALMAQAGLYATALLVVHLLLALAAHALALAAEPAFGADPRRRWVRSAAWLVFGSAWALLANAAWFPASTFATSSWTWAAAPLVAGFTLADAAGALLLAAAALVIGTALVRLLATGGRPRTVTAGALVAASVAAGCAGFLDRAPAPQHARYDKPHVVLIGIDSLRCDVTALGDAPSLTPQIDAFKKNAASFTDAISPLARTFPSWVSILTGRHPTATNARFNLMPRELVHEGDTLAGVLKAHGYRSVYATDEVRFANIDASYGFDQSITPPIGAGDFVFGTINDLPWTNVLSRTWLGARLFPHTHANRAAHVTYDPDHFVQRLERELDVTGPTFVSVHLTLAHWPYSWMGRTEPTAPPDYRTAYVDAVRAVDAQFAAVRDVLERKGLLDDAIVVVLSDHGEALGKQNDTYLRQFKDAKLIWNSVWGHGTSVLSPHQFNVVLSFQRLGGTPLATAGRRVDAPASLEDIRPTVLDLLDLPAGERLTGRSLRPVLDGAPADASLLDRIRFTETDFNTDLVLQGQFDEKGVLKEGAQYYEVAPDSGWLKLRKDRLGELLAKKERAAMTSSWLLAAVPHREGGAMKYILVDRHKGFPARIEARPSDADQPEAARLWDALHAEFAGEMPRDGSASQ
jgi:arylsulfatase A-like enzyme